jgi:predicted extracellular nuclease
MFVMKRKPKYFNLALMFVVLISALGFFPGTVTAATSELFFSEYIEGSSYNKALEIYNGTGAAVDLSTYSISRYSNGASSPTDTHTLSGSLADGDVFVVAHASADPLILAETDLTDGVINHNGDDAYALYNGATMIDVIGRIGEDPGSYWGTGGVTTQDHTLVRKDTICAGDTDGSDLFDPATEWDGYANNYFDALGSHTANCGGAALEPKINEFSADTSPGSDFEFIEIFGEPETDYSTYTVLEVEGGASSSYGVIDEVIPIGTTDVNGFFLQSLAANTLENDSLSLLLVKDFTGSLGEDIDTDDDGVIDYAPWSEVTDSVAVRDDPGHMAYGLPILYPYYDGLNYAPGGASRIPDGFDTETDTDWVRNQFYYLEEPDPGVAFNTPGAPNAVQGCSGPFTPIYDIQGSGFDTPYDGQDVVTEGIVVGDFQEGGKDGFFIQDATGDGDPDTSDGVFVYYTGVDVAVGDHVRLQGEASEYYDATQIGYIDWLEVCAVGEPLPAPGVLTLPVASIDDYEAYEGMLVTFPQDLVIAEYYNFDRYGTIVLASQRYLQFTAQFEPDVTGYAASMDEYALNSITLDDGRTSQNPDPARHPNGLDFDLYNFFRGGELLTNVTGVIDYSYGAYVIQPTEGADYTPTNPRTVAPDILEGDIKVASLNVYNYFTTLDDSGDICGPLGDQGCRGADNPEELERQRAKILSALLKIDADIVGLMEIENDRPGPSPDYAVADLVTGLNDAAGPGTYDYIPTGAIGEDVIKVALIYKPGSVTPMGAFAVLDDSVDPSFLDDYNRPVLAQTFADNIVGDAVTVAVNHLKSKSGPYSGDPDPENPLDFDQGDGASWWNETRKSGAQAEVNWLASDPTGTGVENLLIIGDLNAYDKEDPIDVIKAGADATPGTDDDFVDMIHEFLGEAAYSYLFDGKVGYLDYAMANTALAEYVADTTIWHINADEADLINYDMSFKQDAQDAIYAPDEYRASDHDPVIITLTFNKPPFADDDYYQMKQDDTLDVEALHGVLENDYDLNEHDVITLDVVVQPMHGTVELNHDGSFIYIPDALYFGEDSFEYLLMANPPERGEFSDTATVYITIDSKYKYYFPLGYGD